MQALARAYDLLSREGAYKVPVGDLIRLQLSAFATEGGRYTAAGEPLILRPNAAPSLGLVLYELATNSTKYGALSVPTGHVHVQWRCEARANGREEFILEWKESGGPAVKPPTRQGFGSELVQRQLKYELNGSASMEFHESGIVVTLAIPVEEAVESSASAGEIK
jgi:two-component sensor histidine kinase